MTRDDERSDLVREQLIARGVKDVAVLAAMGTVPREEFVLPAFRHMAYVDCPLPISHCQTISQPYMVAFMLEAAEIDRTSKVLEIGTGSGYAAAVTSLVAGKVVSVEIIPELAREAAEKLRRLHYNNIAINVSDGTQGWPAEAPYDAIIVTAGGTSVPSSLKDQLAVGGRLVIPVGPRRALQDLIRLTRMPDNVYKTVTYFPCTFVPLVGQSD